MGDGWIHCGHRWVYPQALCRAWAVSGLWMICHFSAVHKPQILVMGEKGGALQMTSQSISKSFPWSFNLQIWPESVELVLFSLFLKSPLWPPYLSLKVLAVKPTYFSTVLLLVTLAWYTKLLTVHLPGRGHVDGSWQLHLGGGSFFTWFKILKLCLAIWVFKLGRHL